MKNFSTRAYIAADQLPGLISDRHALFLDLDGTLAEIAPTPQTAFIPDHIINAMRSISIALNNAIAIVSGRSITDIDYLCQPYRFTTAGQHGSELRYPDNHLMQTENFYLMQVARSAAAVLQQNFPALLIEHKSSAVAVHYRQATELQTVVHKQLSGLVALYPELKLQQGKMVHEIRLQGSDKGTAIQELMACEPFKGRTPIFIGDDVTDEDGFAAVNQLGGISVKIGEGVTTAQLRLRNTSELHQWLSDNAVNLARQVYA